MQKLTDIEIHPDDCLLSVSWSDHVAGELQQVVPGFVFVCFFLKSHPSSRPPPSRRLGMEENKQTVVCRVGLPLHFLLKKELERRDSCQCER